MHEEKPCLLERAHREHRSSGMRSPLEQPDWQYLEDKPLDFFSREDWLTLNPQRQHYFAEYSATRALQMLAAQKDAPSFGYSVNTYEHCLQAASMVLRDGHDDDTIVAALFHDLFLETSDENHGQTVAEFLKPYLSEKNYWMLRHHGLFIGHHCPTYPNLDTEAREKYRGHPHFEWTAEFVDKYDQCSFFADYPSLSLKVFEPIVRRVMQRPHVKKEVS